ncbi:MAG: hypothetical protein VX589_05685, partial [Myxococcota bacterium]|nr:hypothetical protein [Myxococcota bacterium]
MQRQSCHSKWAGLIAILWLALGVSSGAMAQEKPTKSVEEKSPSSSPSWYQTPAKTLQIDTLLQLAAGWTELDDENIDARPLLSVHRARIWFRGQVHQRVNYVLHLAFDRIGADQYAMLQAAPLSAGRPVGVQDAIIQYDVLGTGAFRITGGFMRPNVGRESNTPVPAVVTHEPGLTSTLARRMSAGTGHGRAGGVDLGGRIAVGPSHLIYHIGVFTPATAGTSPDGIDYKASMGVEASPLFAGSLIVGFGRLNQMRGGDLLFLPNPWTKGWSVMLGASASAQMKTDAYEQTVVQTYFGSTYVEGFQLDGEFVTAKRENR